MVVQIFTRLDRVFGLGSSVLGPGTFALEFLKLLG